MKTQSQFDYILFTESFPDSFFRNILVTDENMKSSGVRRTFSDGMKYSAVKSSEGSENSNLSEKSPLLENVEKLSISMPVEGEQTSVRRPVTQPEVRSCNEHITSNPGKKVNNSATKDGNGVQLINSDNKTSESKGGIRECQGARPKVPVSLNTSSRCSSGTNETSRENNIDIVRKMSHPDVDGNSQWKVIGPYQKLKLKSCQRLYASTGRADDLALFFHNGRFYIMEAWCTHMGKCLKYSIFKWFSTFREFRRKTNVFIYSYDRLRKVC